MNEVKCKRDVRHPESVRTGVSNAATVGSPTQPRPSEAMVMPSWQHAR